MRVLLLMNSNARRVQQSAQAVTSAFDAAGCEIISATPDADDGGTRIMKKYAGRVDCVVVAGGDGTLISAIGGLLETRLPLGILPLGTFNDLARTLDLPLDPSQAVGVILRGQKRRLDVGRVGEKYFFNEASIGISTRIARRQTPDVKKRFGMLAVIATTIATLGGSRPFSATIRYDGREERFRTLQLTIANSSRFGGIISNKDAAIDDALLDLYSLDIRSWFEIFRLVGPIVRRQIAQSPAIRHRTATMFEVQTRHPHSIFTDGEPAGKTPATFEVLPAAIEVYV